MVIHNQVVALEFPVGVAVVLYLGECVADVKSREK